METTMNEYISDLINVAFILCTFSGETVTYLFHGLENSRLHYKFITRALWIRTVLSHRSVKSVQLVFTHHTS